MSIRLLVCGLLTASGAMLPAQVPDASAPTAPTAPAPGSSRPAAPAAAKPQSGFLGKDVPVFDPGSDVLTWDGKSWNISNNRLFQARFEKYLNAPEETSSEQRLYQGLINEILNRLASGNVSRENVDAAFKLLPQAARYDIDARLCEMIADGVYTVWASQRQQQRLLMANDALERDRKQNEWNATISSQTSALETSSVKVSKGANGGTTTTTTKQVGTITPYLTRLGETMARIKANEAKRELTEVAAKVEYQAMIVQLFLQRRFQHVLVATRFYRAIFADGDSKLNLGKDAKDLFVSSAGMAPTVSTLDSLANEAIRDVREGVRTFEFLLANNELEGATKRLAEAFTAGEFLPEIRTLPRTKKRQALEFTHQANQLLSALDVKDYALAEEIVGKLKITARDFDASKPLALIQSSKTLASFRLAKARNAALSGDRQTLEAELTAATELWPRNPELDDVSKKIFAQGDVQQRSISDFDQLYAQKNYRQIFENSGRFSAATALYPDRQDQLRQVMQDLGKIEGAIMQAQEMRRQGNGAGAWESVEKAAELFPDDSKLNQLRADLTTQAAEFVHTVRRGQELEKRDQTGSSLSWFLKAQKTYPASDYAREGIERMKKKIFPES